MNEDLDPRVRLAGAGVGVLLCAAYAAAFVGAYASQAWVVVAAIVVAQLCEPLAERSLFVRPVLRRAQMGPAARSILRDAAVLMLVANARWAPARDVRDLERAVGI